MVRRNPTVPDIKQRLTLFELFFDYTRDADWLEKLGYTNEASVSRIKNRKQGIPEKAIKQICKDAGIEIKQFFLPLVELAELLDVTGECNADEIITTIAARSPDLSGELYAVDKDMLAKLPSSYIMLYPGREEMHIDRAQIIVEKFEVLADQDDQKCRVVQISNVITGERAEGVMRPRGSVVLFNLEYKKAYYPDSTFLMQPIVLDQNIKILSGLYMDVAPLAYIQVFATQCCMFSVPDSGLFPRRYPKEHKLFSVWNSILNNKTEHRGRLISKSGDDFYERVRQAVLETIENEGV